MSEKKIATSYPGVRYKEHKTRKYGVRFDRYFYIRYKLNGKDKEEGVGWASSGMTAEKASRLLGEIRENIKKSDGPQSLSESREIGRQKELERKNAAEKAKRHNISYDDFFQQQYIPSTSLHKKTKSVNSELQHHKNWILPVLQSIPIKDISLAELEKIVTNLQEAGRSKRTIQYVLATISQVWNYARKVDIVSGDSPTRKIKIGKIDNARERFLTEAEAGALLNIIGTHSIDTRDICIFSLFAGLRASEIFKLQWSDINMESGTMSIRSPKSGKSRFAYITSKIRNIILGKLPQKVSNEQLLFPSKDGGQRVAISKTFSICVNALGLNDGISDRKQKIIFHSLRHTFGSWLAIKGVPLYTIQTLMGLSSFQMVQRYAHLSEQSRRDAAHVLDSISIV